MWKMERALKKCATTEHTTFQHMRNGNTSGEKKEAEKAFKVVMPEHFPNLLKNNDLHISRLNKLQTG